MARHDEPSKTERQLLAIKQGILQVLAGGKTIFFRGQSCDQAKLLQVVDGLLAPFVNVRHLRTLLEEGMEGRHTNSVDADEFVKLFKVAAEAAYGESSIEFTEFGFSPKKKAAALTPEQKQHKLEQMRATRLARRTMGKRQKRAVKGDVKPPQGPTP